MFRLHHALTNFSTCWRDAVGEFSGTRDWEIVRRRHDVGPPRQPVVTDCVGNLIASEEGFWHTLVMTPSAPPANPFLKLSFLEFLAVSTLTLAFFPISLLFCFVAFGAQTTRFLVEALVRDWVQTLMIVLLLGVTVAGLLLWSVMSWLG